MVVAANCFQVAHHRAYSWLNDAGLCRGGSFTQSPIGLATADRII
jgi:hypothetical protein